MTFGNPYKLLFSFSIPLLLGNVFEQLYNMVDSIVVGNFVGEKALAAVGTGFPIIFMLSSLFIGLGIGSTIMISQYYGAKDFENIQNTINTIYIAMMVGTIPLTIMGILFSEPLLRLMKVPDDGTLAMAKVYLVVIFAGIIGNLGYNINAGILQGLGDSRTSLLFLLVATIINIVLDLL
ncbi:MAG: oligosaccharide flippase family protein, partial [Clostridiales bacterium]|nr:oligosaccharide flippase family protein [Clostridiales bacterium]